MTEQRFSSIEQRTKQVEEAVIKFGYIADTVLVRHDSRMTALELDVDTIKTSIYQTCDAKTHEIDTKIETAFSRTATNQDKAFKQAIGISTGMFMLFIGALTYLNSEHGKMYERMNVTQQESVEHRTNIKAIFSILNRISDKMDDIHKDLN